jgi:hypothetical protein
MEMNQIESSAIAIEQTHYVISLAVIGLYLIVVQLLLGTRQYSKKLPRISIPFLGVAVGILTVIPLEYWILPWAVTIVEGGDAGRVPIISLLIVISVPFLFHYAAKLIVLRSDAVQQHTSA